MGVFVLACLIIGVVGGGVVGVKYFSSDHYRQKMQLGEFFTVYKFGSNETVETAMDLDYLISTNKGKVKKGKDKFGWFLDYTDPRGPLRVYLPKNEWFNGGDYKDTVKSFWDRESNKTENINCFHLCFVLTSPSLAIPTYEIDPKTGVMNYKLPVDSVTRGWEVLKVHKQSGYFSREGNKLRAKVFTSEQFNRTNINEIGLAGEYDNSDYYGSQKYIDDTMRERRKTLEKRKLSDLQQKIQEAQEGGGSGLFEYTYSSYGEEYAKNEFDVWYDSFYGQAIAVGTQICIGIGTGGFATWVVEGMNVAKVSYAAMTTMRAGIIIGSELIVGVPEAVYLYNRGYTSIAALIALCCFIPLVTDFQLGRMILKLPPSDMKLIHQICKEAVDKDGKIIWTSIRDFRNFMKKLSITEQKILAEQLSAVAAYYEKNGTKEIVQKSIKSLSEKYAELSKIKSFKFKGNDILTRQNYIKRLVFLNLIVDQQVNIIKQADNVLGALSFNSKPILSSLGFTLFGLMGPMLVISVIFIGNDEKQIKDPQNILNGSEKALAYFYRVIPKAYEELQRLLLKNNQEIQTLMQTDSKDNLKRALELSYTNYVILKNAELFTTQTKWSNEDFANKQGNIQEKIAYGILSRLQITYVNQLINKGIEAENEGNQKEADDAAAGLKDAYDNKKTQDIKTLNKGGRFETCESCLNISSLSIPIPCKDENKIFTYNKSDVDSFFKWILGIDVTNCTDVDKGKFKTLGSNFIYTRNVYTLDNSGKPFATKKTFRYGSSNPEPRAQLKNYCNEYQDKSSLNSQFYQLSFVRYLFTQFFDNWVISEKGICSSSVGDLIKKDETIPNKNLNTTDKSSENVV